MAIPSPPRTSASSGKMSPTTSDCRLPVLRRAPRRWQAAQGRDHRRADDQVQLGQAQPLFHRKPGAGGAPLPVPAGALPQEAPRQVHARGGYPEALQGQQLDQHLPAPGRDVRQQQCRHADAQPVGAHHGPAGPALRLRAQSLLSPHRREGTAAPLHRRRDHDRGGGQPDPRQGGPRRGRPSAALSQHARLHLPAEERQDIGRHRSLVGVRLRIADRPLP